MKSLLEKGPREFPRLYYLTDRDLLTVVSNKGEPVSLIPIISKIFPAIKTLRFTEYAASKNSINPATNDDEGVWCGVVWCGVVWCGVVWH